MSIEEDGHLLLNSYSDYPRFYRQSCRKCHSLNRSTTVNLGNPPKLLMFFGHVHVKKNSVPGSKRKNLDTWSFNWSCKVKGEICQSRLRIDLSQKTLQIAGNSSEPCKHRTPRLKGHCWASRGKWGGTFYACVEPAFISTSYPPKNKHGLPLDPES